jgi:hypothetical protein
VLLLPRWSEASVIFAVETGKFVFPLCLTYVPALALHLDMHSGPKAGPWIWTWTLDPDLDLGSEPGPWIRCNMWDRASGRTYSWARGEAGMGHM